MRKAYGTGKTPPPNTLEAVRANTHGAGQSVSKRARGEEKQLARSEYRARWHQAMQAGPGHARQAERLACCPQVVVEAGLVAALEGQQAFSPGTTPAHSAYTAAAAVAAPRRGAAQQRCRLAALLGCLLANTRRERRAPGAGLSHSADQLRESARRQGVVFTVVVII